MDSQADRTQINPNMIVLAREIRGLTQSELADRLGVSQGKVSKLEDGLSKLNDHELKSLTKSLEFPASFFFRDDVSPSAFTWFYRKRASIPTKLLVQFNARVCWRLAQIERLRRKTEIDGRSLPYCDPNDYKGGPVEIAGQIRQFLGVPPGPVKNLVGLLEGVGIFVVEEDFGTLKLDGVSAFTRSGTPVMFLNSAFPRSRRVFTAVHELGHLIMHRLPRPEAEDETNEFTAEFLLPKDQIRPDFRSCEKITLDTLARLKLKWRVSIGALLKRALMLRFIDQGRFVYLRVQMNQQGYRLDEPHELLFGIHPPSLERELVEIHLKELGYSTEDMCNLLDFLTVDDFEEQYGARHPFLRVLR